MMYGRRIKSNKVHALHKCTATHSLNINKVVPCLSLPPVPSARLSRCNTELDNTYKLYKKGTMHVIRQKAIVL